MHQVTVLLVSLLALLKFYTAFAAEEDYWADRAVKLDVFDSQVVTALAAANGILYIGAGKTLFTLRLTDNMLIEHTAKIEKSPDDEITSILVHPEKDEVWISTNNNTFLGKCYRYDLSRCQTQSSFLKDQLKEYTNLPTPACCGIETFATEGGQIIEGYFKGNIYLCSQETRECKSVYKPTSYYNWAVASLMTKTTAYVATRGDGLIVTNRKTGTAVRFHDKDQNYIRSIAINGNDIFFGAIGLYRANVKDFAQ